MRVPLIKSLLLTVAAVAGLSVANRIPRAAAADSVADGPKSQPSKSAAAADSATRRHLRGVMLVGYPGAGHGTGWVLSRKHRLIVTNAHVADIWKSKRKLVAIADRSRHTYRVTRHWYHPGLKRYLSGEQLLSVRSRSPWDGPVNVMSPDVAVLQLAAGGPELPAEMPLATPAELAALQGKSIAIFGYPASDTLSWPKPGEVVSATFDRGTVRRLTDFSERPRMKDSENQLLEYSIANFGGFSGSPLFLSNGHVVGLNNAFGIRKDRGIVRQKTYGIRVDCLWELLVHHKLTDKVAIPDVALDIKRWLQPGPNDEKYRRAIRLLNEGNDLNTQNEFSKAVVKYNEAMELAGVNFGLALSFRAGSYSNFANLRAKTQQQRQQYLNYALQDIRAALRSIGDPNRVGAIRTHLSIALSLASMNRNTKDLGKLLAAVDRLLQSPKLTTVDRATLLSLKGVILAEFGRDDDALQAHSAAIKLSPDVPALWENRASFWGARKQAKRQQADLSKAQELREKLRRKKT